MLGRLQKQFLPRELQNPCGVHRHIVIHFGFILVLILMIGPPRLTAAEPTNSTATVQESWQTISNRWGSNPLEKIQQAARDGEVTAQYYLGRTYDSGNGVETNASEAFRWMKLAAEQGMARAQTEIGWMYQSGSGIETDLAQAKDWYEKAAQQGNAQAQMNLGWMYDTGTGVPQDYAEAARFYRLAAEQGHAAAQNNLGWLYFYVHEGVPQNPDEGIKWFQKSAEQGEPSGEKNLARAYAMNGYTNLEIAESWMKKAVDLNSAQGQYEYGHFLCDEFDKHGNQITNNFPIAAEWFRKAAEQGHAKAQYELAEMYHNGLLGDGQRSNSIPWFLKAAAQGNVEARAVVGELPKYYPNSPLLKSVDTLGAVRQAAESGNLNAQYQLAKRYQFGIGVPKDSTNAFYWMEKAAQHPQPESSKVSDAIYELGVMYEKGEGVEADLKQAQMLFLQAAAGHQWDAAFRAGQMYEKGQDVPQDDHMAVEYYCNKLLALYVDPQKYPDGVIQYAGMSAEAIEGLTGLLAEGRGLPTEDEKNKSVIASPLICSRITANR